MVILPGYPCCKVCGWGCDGIPESVEMDVECDADGRSLYASVSATYTNAFNAVDQTSSSASFSLPTVTGTYSLSGAGFFRYSSTASGGTIIADFYQPAGGTDWIFQSRFAASGPATGSIVMSSTLNGTRTKTGVGASFSHDPWELCTSTGSALTSNRYAGGNGSIFSGPWNDSSYLGFFKIQPAGNWLIGSAPVFASGCQLPSTAAATGTVVFDQQNTGVMGFTITSSSVDHTFDSHSSAVINNGNTLRHTFSFTFVHKITAVRLIYGSHTKNWFFSADTVNC